MSKLELVQGEITHIRFGMGVSIAVMFSMLGYIATNIKTDDIVMLTIASLLALLSSFSLIYLQTKINKKIKSLGDL